MHHPSLLAVPEFREASSGACECSCLRWEVAASSLAVGQECWSTRRALLCWPNFQRGKIAEGGGSEPFLEPLDTHRNVNLNIGETTCETKSGAVVDLSG